MGKKLLRAVLCAAMLTLALTTAAFAAEGDITKVNATDATRTVGETYDSYTVSYTDAGLAGKQCVLLVVTGTYDGTTANYSIGESTIQYIDQTAADENGAVSFTYIPKSTPDSVVLMGAEGLSSPVLLATVESKGVTVTGNVDFLCSATKATVSLTDEAGNVFSTETAAGAYEITSVPDGTYTLSITKKGHLPYSATVTIDADNTTLGDVTLLGGDVDDDSRYINANDLSALIASYKDESAVNDAVNINEDASVNATDLSTLLANFKKAY